MLVCVVTWRKMSHEFVGARFTCLVGACARYDKPQTQSIHWDSVDPSIRAPKLTVGPDLASTTKLRSNYHVSICFFSYEEPHAMDMLLFILHVLWGHRQSLIDLENTINSLGPCSSKLQSTQYVGPDLVSAVKIMMPSSCWCMLSYEESWAMNVLMLVTHVLWVHVQDMTSM